MAHRDGHRIRVAWIGLAAFLLWRAWILPVLLGRDAGGDVSGGDTNPRPCPHRVNRPSHGHGPGEPEIVGLEVDRLHHPLVGHDLDEAGLDHVRIG